MVPRPELISYILGALAVPLVLHYHLLPAVFAGMAVHVLTVRFAQRVPATWSNIAREITLGNMIVLVILGLCGIGFGLWSVLHGDRGMAALLATVAEILERVKRSLPADVADLLPDTMEDLHSRMVVMLREHGQKISVYGMAGLKTFAHVLLGMVVGGMTSLHHFDKTRPSPVFIEAIHSRVRVLADAFEKVVFAQVKISALNTVLTALYLIVILPLFGIHLPMVTILIPFTFVAGLLPVVGNLLSNAAILLISLGTSTGVAIASFAFLVVIHKLEYFMNARIVGEQVNARAWELLCAMLLMEAIFGVPGLVAAPVIYAWLKAELAAKNLL